MAYPTHDSKKSNFPFQLPRSGGSSFFFSSSGTATGSSSSKGTACLTCVGEFNSTVLCPVFPMVGWKQTSGIRKSVGRCSTSLFLSGWGSHTDFAPLPDSFRPTSRQWTSRNSIRIEGEFNSYLWAIRKFFCVFDSAVMEGNTGLITI